MAKGNNQKYKLYYLAKIMMEETDEDHFITMPEILKKLEGYEVSAERKSIYQDLKDLERFGLEIEGLKEGRNFIYHVISQSFEVAELKLLVDAIQSSKFITERKSNELIKKLETLVSRHEAKQLHRQIFIADRIKTMNESIYYNVDEIYNAMAKNQKITFQYYQWNLKKEMELKHGGAYYEISPLGLSWDDENYYLVGHDSKEDKIKHFRVDKMIHIKILEEKRVGKEQFEELNMATYAKKSFGMFGGEEKTVKLHVKNYLAGVMIDRFGKDIFMIPADSEHFTVNVDVQVSRQFIGWIFSLGDGVKIISPEDVVEEAKKEIGRLIKQYEL
ncbi:MAG: WYL domain-containing protein [Eubacteriales bacterium]|nr:WYL domain-containing protein [Eubacteriales bacterium]